ncbi:hypothetical protein KJ652_06620 [Patescibacteria group bacterium]|nr:hypothetical protein [Patescibacteria group bacterium]MBU1124224.1 hypothetical protein [Patescibacteria group bacterium]MBU1911503.1 hypothetical protein [Patescibacteria group bacterium]
MTKHKPMLDKCRNIYLSVIERKHPVFNSILIGTAIVLFWRGIWGLLDLYLFPNNETASFAFSALLGILILLIHDGMRDLKELE